MANMHSETHENEGDLSRFIAREMVKRLQLEEMSGGLAHHIQKSIE
jgi:hypothetical protein